MVMKRTLEEQEFEKYLQYILVEEAPIISEEEIQTSWEKITKRIAVWEELQKNPLKGNHQSDYKISPSGKN